MPVRFCTSHIKHTFHRAIFVGLKNYIFTVHIHQFTSIILHTHSPPVYPTDLQADNQSKNTKKRSIRKVPCPVPPLAPLKGLLLHVPSPWSVVYKWYTPPIGWLYITYRLLREPETAIELKRELGYLWNYITGLVPGNGFLLGTLQMAEPSASFPSLHWRSCNRSHVISPAHGKFVHGRNQEQLKDSESSEWLDDSIQCCCYDVAYIGTGLSMPQSYYTLQIAGILGNIWR